MSLDAWGALPEDAPGELVDGLLTEDEVPDVVHEAVVTWLLLVLGPWARAHDARVLSSGVKFGVTDDRGRLADLSLFLGGRRPPARGVVRVPPDIAIEVVSTAPSDVPRDRVEKVADYARFGVRWYWLVDPGLRTFEILELRDGVYAAVGAADADLVSDVPGCPDLVLDLDALWAEVDALG
jgi:Uma2 family endonuclease